jgi:peptide/nickel transport system ATP-binding protein
MSAAGKPILTIKALTVDFLSEDAAVRAVDDVSFDVCEGETLVILGESGSGKSVSTGTVMGLIDCPPGDIVAGSVVFDGIDLTSLGQEGRRQLNGRRMAMIFQDPLAYLNPVISVGRQIEEVFESHQGGGTAASVRSEVAGLLERVGISDAARRFHDYPHQFSGGQRQRIMIAMAIALKPEILIADEPTTALDVSVQAQILELLQDLQRETGMALILITHDLEVAAAMGDRIIVMNGGKVVETGRAEDVFTRPMHAYTKRLMAAVPHAAPAVRPGRQPAAREALLTVEHLSKHFTLAAGPFAAKREFRAVDDVSFTVGRGETVGIVGESGSGKSSIARMLLRLSEPTAGRALLAGEDIFTLQGRALNDYRRRVQMVFQDPFGSMNPRMTVSQIISEPWAIHRDILERPRWHERVVELLERVGLKPEHCGRYPHQFSGGQRQRIAIARALASDPELIVCDEAVSALDVSIQMQVIELLAELRQSLGLSYIFITHDLPIVRQFADRVLVMKAGKIVEEGATEAIFDNPCHDYTRVLLNAVPRPKWLAAEGR